MDFGKKLQELRKSENLSQEELAEIVGVTRQTISKWELGETVPDIKQAKILSRRLKVSMDELSNNEIENIMIEKVCNTDKKTSIILKIVKIFFVIFIISTVINLILVVTANFLKFDNESFNEEQEEITMTCEMNEDNYIISLNDNEKFKCTGCDDGMVKVLTKKIDFKNLNKSEDNIKNYFIDNGGNCN